MTTFINDDQKKIELADFIIQAVNRVERGYHPAGESSDETLKDFAKLFDIATFLSPRDIAIRLGTFEEDGVIDTDRLDELSDDPKPFLSFDTMCAVLGHIGARGFYSRLSNVFFNAGFTIDHVYEKIERMNKPFGDDNNE